MNAWERYWFGPVAAIRPFLFARLFMALLAFDLWVDFVGRGARYGVGGINVAHFAWLDRIQPTPSPTLYVALIVVASFAAMAVAIGGVRRPLAAVACLAFTYAWMMSQQDSYQHHYLLSLVLLCVALMPDVKPDQLALPAPPASSKPADRSEPRVPLVSAWAYVMLGTQVAVVYLWTAIAKMGAEWIAGHPVRRLMLGDNDGRADHLANRVFERLGAWPALSVGAIIMELALAVGYLYALGRDRRTGRTSRRVCLALWAVALALHGGILLMPLSIGMFSYYMVTTACVFLPPATWLHRVAAVGSRPPRAIAALIAPLFGGRRPRASAALLAVIVAVALAVVGSLSAVPGIAAGAVVAAILLAAVVGFDLAADAAARARPAIVAAALLVAVMLIAEHASEMPYRFHTAIARAHDLIGDPQTAVRHYRTAESLTDPDRLTDMFCIGYGEALLAVDRPADALRYFEAAVRVNPDNGYAHSSCADALMPLRRYDQAIDHYAAAARLEPDNAWLRHNHAFALLQADRLDDAVAQYRAAIGIDPDLIESHNDLAAVLLRLRRPDEAAVHLRHVIRLNPHDAQATNNLAWILATSDSSTPADRDEALRLAALAAELTDLREPVVLGTLAEALFRVGRPADAVRMIDSAIELARNRRLADLADQLAARRRRYAADDGG